MPILSLKYYFVCSSLYLLAFRVLKDLSVSFVVLRRSTMGQDRTSDLALLAIEQEAALALDINNIIKQFARRGCRLQVSTSNRTPDTFSAYLIYFSEYVCLT